MPSSFSNKINKINSLHKCLLSEGIVLRFMERERRTPYPVTDEVIMATEYRPGQSQTDEEKQAITLEVIKDPRIWPAIVDRLPEHITPERLRQIGADVEQAIARSCPELQPVLLTDIVPEVLDEIGARWEAIKQHGAATVGFPTNIKKLDNLLGGLQAGNHIFAAEPGAGKTSFALQIAGTVARQGHPVLFISFEEALWKLTLKALCSAARFESKKFQDGYGNPADLQQAAEQYGPGLRTLRFIDGTQSPSMEQVKAMAFRLIEASQVRKCLIIVDYLQIWAGMRREQYRFSDFRHVVDALVMDIRKLSLSLQSPVILISSQNRAGQGDAKKTSLKESGGLEYSADSIWFLVNDEKRSAISPDRAVKLVIEKNRYGDTGKIELIFKPHIGTFAEVSTL